MSISAQEIAYNDFAAERYVKAGLPRVRERKFSRYNPVLCHDGKVPFGDEYFVENNAGCFHVMRSVRKDKDGFVEHRFHLFRMCDKGSEKFGILKVVYVPAEINNGQSKTVMSFTNGVVSAIAESTEGAHDKSLALIMYDKFVKPDVLFPLLLTNTKTRAEAKVEFIMQREMNCNSQNIC